jgi:FG-GAP repeat
LLRRRVRTGRSGGSVRFRLDGEGAFESSGFSVSSAGDVNGDGFDDIIIGAFAAGVDKIQLENAVFTGLSAGALLSAAFFTGSAALAASDFSVIWRAPLAPDRPRRFGLAVRSKTA